MTTYKGDGMQMVQMAAIDKADTAWILVSTVLVLLMTLPGIALFYAGLVRRKNVVNTLVAVFAVAAVVSLTWFAVGYSLAFSKSSAWLGGLDRAWFSAMRLDAAAGTVSVSHLAPNIPEALYALFQMAFAVITTTLIIGAVVERMRFRRCCCSLRCGVCWSMRRWPIGCGRVMAG